MCLIAPSSRTSRQKVRAHCVVQTKGNDITRKSNQRDGSFLLVFPLEETCSTKNGDGRLSKSLTATAAFGSWIWPANSKPLRSRSVRISRFCTHTAWFIVGMEAHCRLARAFSLVGPIAEETLLNQIVGGWQIGGIASVSSGNWFTILDANGVANSDGQQRPDLIGDPRATPCEPGTFFNTCAFADPASGSFGDVRRNSVQGPGYQIWDFSLFKNFPITERAKLEFRAEFFNVFDHPNLQFAKAGPQNSIDTTTFGTPQFGFLTAARDPRQVQLALKLSF